MKHIILFLQLAIPFLALSQNTDPESGRPFSTLLNAFRYNMVDSAIVRRSYTDIYLDLKKDGAKGEHYALQLAFPNDTCLYQVEENHPNSVRILIGKKCLRRTFSDNDPNKWAFVFTETTQKTCDYCIHFDLGPHHDIWIEPNGNLYWDGKFIQKDFGTYLLVMSEMLRIERGGFEY